MNKFNLFISYWKSPSDIRNAEICDTINSNILSNLFNKIYIFVDEYLPDIIKSDIVSYEFSVNNNLSDILQFIESKTDFSTINVLANSDIKFDETLKLANQISFNELYSLTRYEDDGCLHNSTSMFGTSQDCWIYKGTFKSKFNYFNYPFFGRIGCDGKFAYDLITTGYVVQNPCKSIKIHHVHKSNLREGSSNPINSRRLPFPHAFIVKSDIKDKSKLTDYLFFSDKYGHIRYDPVSKTLKQIFRVDAELLSNEQIISVDTVLNNNKKGGVWYQ